jgi:hypothetical protein
LCGGRCSPLAPAAPAACSCAWSSGRRHPKRRRRHLSRQSRMQASDSLCWPLARSSTVPSWQA